MANVATAKQQNKKILTAVIAVAFVALLVLLILLLSQKNGFVREDGEVYYYKNNEMQVGWQIIDNERYYFDADGKMHRGWLVWEKDAFYFRQGKDGDANDIGGTLLISTQAVLKDVDGIRWYIEFGANGKVINSILDVDWYKSQGLEIPDVTEPNFG